MNALDVLSVIGRDAPMPMILDIKRYGHWFQTMAPVTRLSDGEFAQRDIGQLNLECAMGLPAAESLNFEIIKGYCLKLNEWADQIRTFTKKRQNGFKRRPWEYGNSQGMFRMQCLATYVYRHLGIRYNQAFLEGEYNASDSRNLFLHGVLSGHGGTCATMPFLYLALGRRLGYPLRLVHAKEHSFVRWDEPGGERFNIEATSPGFNPRPDSHYHQWPKPLTEEEIEKGNYLRSLLPRHELASILHGRVWCLVEHLRFGEAILACFLMAQLAGDDEREHWVLGTWSVVTVMARAVEEARQAAGLQDYQKIDLRKVFIPESKPPMGPWVAAAARDVLQRVARNREKARDAAFARATTTVRAGQCQPHLEKAAARRIEAPVDMADPADVLLKMGYDWPGPVEFSVASHDRWFRMMIETTLVIDQELVDQDIGSLNHKVAVGLPGAESVSVDACVQTLNAWSRQVRAFTEEYWSQFEKSPERFGNSAAYFRVAALVTVLQEHLGVRCDPSFGDGDYNASDSRNLFVHGLLSGHGGTCVTLPVLYVAIGRRLRYPLRLVRAKQHLFVRWDEPGGERFNIESTDTRFEPLDDAHFRRWPMPLTDYDLQSGMYLRNLPQREEMADFLCLRAECLLDNLRPIEALQAAYLAAGFLAPGDVWLKRTWCVTTVLARALEQARVKARQKDYADLNLQEVCVHEGEGEAGGWAAAMARHHLRRIARIRENPGHHPTRPR